MSWIKDAFTPDPDEVDQVKGLFTSTRGLIAIGLLACALVAGIVLAFI